MFIKMFSYDLYPNISNWNIKHHAYPLNLSFSSRSINEFELLKPGASIYTRLPVQQIAAVAELNSQKPNAGQEGELRPACHVERATDGARRDAENGNYGRRWTLRFVQRGQNRVGRGDEVGRPPDRSPLATVGQTSYRFTSGLLRFARRASTPAACFPPSDVLFSFLPFGVLRAAYDAIDAGRNCENFNLFGLY